MRSKVLVILFLFFGINFGITQQIEKGEILKDRQFLIDKKEMTASDEYGNFIAIRPHRINGTLRNYYVESYIDLNFQYRTEIETENDTDILKVFILNRKAHVLIKERDGNSISLRLDIYDIANKSLTRTSLLKVNKEENKPLFKALRNDYYIDLNVSEYLILNLPVVEDKLTYAHVQVFDQDIVELRNFKVFADESTSHKNTSFLNVKYLNKTLYALFQLNDEDNDNLRYYRLIELTQQGKRNLDIQIPENSYELINSKINNDHMIIAGLYSRFKRSGFEGFTYYSVNINTFEIEAQKQTPFFNEAASNYFKGLFTGNRSIDINNLFIDDQLNTYIIGQFYILRENSAPVGIPIASFSAGSVSVFITVNPVNYTYKVFDDILIGKISPQGELSWDNVLELRRTEKITSKSNKRDSSSFICFANDQLNIFVNGFIDPEKSKLILKQNKRLNKTNFYNIIVNPHGGIKPTIVFPNEGSDIIFRAENAINSNGIIHILGQGNMRKQLLKLQL